MERLSLNFLSDMSSKTERDSAVKTTQNQLREIRCKKCGRLLMKGEVKVIEIKCPKCGYIQIVKNDNSVKVKERE